MEHPLYISTLDLLYYGHGGVVTKALMFAEFVRAEGFQPVFITPSVPLHRTIRRQIRGNDHPLHRQTSFGGYPCHEFAALYPEWECHAHRFDLPSLEKVISRDAPCFAISGNNHAARPFLELGRKFSIWPGSTFWEDCKDRVLNSPWSARKILDLASRPFSEKLEKQIFQAAHEMVVDTVYTRTEVLKRGSSWAPKVHVVPVPVNCSHYQPLKNPPRSHLIFLGRLSDPRKNISLLLDAFQETAPSQPQLRLLLLGTGDNAFAARLASHPFRERIDWQIKVSEREKIDAIQNALALVIPSHQEGYGIVGAEALACGVPVISTPCGGSADYVVNEQTGIQLKTFETHEMAKAIQSMVTQAPELTGSCRGFAVEKLSYEAVKPRLSRFIRGCLSQEP